jgi:hypothetical protein
MRWELPVKMTLQTDSIPSDGSEITLHLDYWEARNLLFAIRAAKAKTEKRIDPEFAPEPGHIDVNRARIQSLDSAGTKIHAAISAFDEAHGGEPT